MLEYSQAYLRENERILDQMDEYMTPAAIALAKQMATEVVSDYVDDDED